MLEIIFYSTWNIPICSDERYDDAIEYILSGVVTMWNLVWKSTPKCDIFFFVKAHSVVLSALLAFYEAI